VCNNTTKLVLIAGCFFTQASLPKATFYRDMPGDNVTFGDNIFRGLSQDNFGKMYKLLIADDEEKERNGIAMLLRRLGFKFEVFQAKNGMEALKLFEKEDFDVLLTDIKMPFMDGIELIEKVHNLGWDPLYIIYSAYGEFEYARSAIELGVCHYLLKPVSPECFQKVISDVVELCAKRREDITCRSGNYTAAVENIEDLNSIIRKVKELVLSNYADHNLSLSLIAEKLSLSPSYLSFLFKSETGDNLSKYINNTRLERAKDLLRKTNFRIGAVGTRVGITNESYFIKRFREKEGISPLQYRENETPGD
jgi:two-component system response regulator YesN